ncbi:lactation elevated protein 1 homolog B-like [Gouania willdenowi]|uniref:lactation elevated protein 1 homolog B-like n=1 Tax=Gouania willdenowi TaxID=441366 RepID=UPI00105481DF|nr:lactation elevated protein 1 homolog B-like [Gouania willdenowi]
MAACMIDWTVKCSKRFLIKTSVFTSTTCFHLVSGFRKKTGDRGWRTISSSASTSSSSCSTSSTDPADAEPHSSSDTVAHFDRLIQGGSLKRDTQQRRVLQQLAHLQHTMKSYSNSHFLQDANSCIKSEENKGEEHTEKVK